MCRPYLLRLAVLALLAVATPFPASGEDTMAFGLGDGEDFGWALITDRGQTVNGGIFDRETLEDLGKRYGGELLLVKDGAQA